MTNTSGGGSRFDPRFDPAFQPGYDPTSDPRPDTRPDGGSPQLRNGNVVMPMPGSPAGRTTGTGATGTGRTGTGATGTEVTGSSEIHDVEIVEPANETVVETRRVNPFLIAIWVLSALFIVAGLSLLRYMGERLDALNSTGGGSSADYYVLNSYATGAPLLVVLGLATATGSLFLLARRRPRRNG
ncbi:hypothetical protein [Glaciihabitans sp. UYNi722]|uniref:hypothetical protein n=1 Tax=Glaciihabitans sp. UYNi722 TaxID=3156344 RepID=UPI0033976726